jgi:hypothetical protein
MRYKVNRMPKSIAVYGSYIYQAQVKQRYWKKRKDGVKQRYWKTKRGVFKKAQGKGRYEFTGQGRDLYRAVITAHHYMPKGYIEVEARDFLDDPDEYGWPGAWIDREIDS